MPPIRKMDCAMKIHWLTSNHQLTEFTIAHLLNDSIKMLPSSNSSFNSSLSNHHNLDSTVPSSSDDSSNINLSNSIHSVLTQPALITLSQLLPNQLLNGLDLNHSVFSLNYLNKNSNVLSTHSSFSVNQSIQPNLSTNTTLEQLSPSSISLPITSISSIWRLLNCLEWINFRGLNQTSNFICSKNVIQSSDHSLKSPPAASKPFQTQSKLDIFDLTNTLQHVGDILSAISSESDVEIVFNHFFYLPKSHTIELSKLNSNHHHSSSDPRNFSNLANHHDHHPSGSNNSFFDSSNQNSDPFFNTATNGESDLREIWVRADEKGLIVGLTCLLRQILYRAKRLSTIHVILHLTPLHSNSTSTPTSTSTSAPNQKDQQTISQLKSNPELAPVDNLTKSALTSWKCVFDLSLTPPPHHKSNHQSPSNSIPQCNSDENPFENSKSNLSNTLSRLQMSSNLTSELPTCPEESLSKIIFENFLGMKLSTGRVTSSGHSWKITGILEKADIVKKSQEPHQTHQQLNQVHLTSSALSREPTADELSTFAETTLKGKKAVFFADEQSIFAKHITTYLTSWNVDVYHMPYETTSLDPQSQSFLTSYNSLSHSNLSTTINAAPNLDSLTHSQTSTQVHPSSTNIVNLTSNDSNLNHKSIWSNSFIIIDNDITTLKSQLVQLKTLSPALLSLTTNFLPTKPQQPQRPPMSHRVKSANQVERFEGPCKRFNPSIIYFTSISNFRQVQDIIRTHLTGTPWNSIPDVLVIPKPIGPRRILTALHTAISRPMTDPQIFPIATSPSSPGTTHHFGHHHSHVPSQLGKTSPANYLGVNNEFDAAAGNYLKNECNHNIPPSTDHPNLVRVPSLQSSSTPSGLRTPGTAPGTPGVPSPALLSNEALEYFSRAASENGGSSSTGVVLQSPEGRPQAMFFHHSTSSNRLRNESLNQSGSYFSSLNMVNGLIRSSSGRVKRERVSSLSKPMVRELLIKESDVKELNSNQETIQSETSLESSPNPSLTSPKAVVKSNEKANHSLGAYSASNSAHHAIHPLKTSSSNQNLTKTALEIFPHAIALDQYEAISPKTPKTAMSVEGLAGIAQPPLLSPNVMTSPSFTSTPTQISSSTNQNTPNGTLLSSCQLTLEQQQLLNHRPVPLLRMPSIPASLPNLISVTLPPRRPPVTQHSTANPPLLSGKNRQPNSSPSQAHRATSAGELTVKKNEVGKPLSDLGLGGAPNNEGSKPLSTSLMSNRRALSIGDKLGRKRTSRKPTATLVPPINVLIVEDNIINQAILVTFLRKRSVKFDVAIDGQQAVDKWKTGSFHLVLMDIQLPVKDGIEATKEIREAERAVNINAFANTPPAAGGNTPLVLTTSQRSSNMRHNASVIIVALTASSLDVDRDVALAAGCNDFLTKPVALGWLEKKLLEWGSMAWLSGFSRPIPSQQSSNRSLSGSVSVGLGNGNLNNPPLSFAASISERKVNNVAQQLHLRSSKKPLSADDHSQSEGSVLSDLKRSRLESASDQSGTEEDSLIKSETDEMNAKGVKSIKNTTHEQNNDASDDVPTQLSTPNQTEAILRQPLISIQMPTPERFGPVNKIPKLSNPNSIRHYSDDDQNKQRKGEAADQAFSEAVAKVDQDQEARNSSQR
ncbi:hypothetical protein O181_019697 [Austropuccinia psidii MF-1]|uniref:Response regulatory domain-containing protein n=1 Tax=Austropuccinia psidii MF-1 TaxID=1389203 RepID=A0A9Q3GUN7_9BASI|nr:hypothetical protein [Austropuccinia psidii MF-1]